MKCSTRKKIIFEVAEEFIKLLQMVSNEKYLSVDIIISIPSPHFIIEYHINLPYKIIMMLLLASLSIKHLLFRQRLALCQLFIHIQSL